MSIFRTEIWKTGVITAPIERIIEAGSIDPFPIHWLPLSGSFRSLSDPFGLWHKGDLYVLTTYYDYRTRKSVIKAFRLNGMFQVMEERIVLSEAWNLAYPTLIEEDGEIWMLPDPCGSGRLTLYRAIDFPWRWEAVPDFVFPSATINATPVKIDGQWWMFYTSADPATEALKLARSTHLAGPWGNIPVQRAKNDKNGSRMGGTPVVQDGAVVLPTRTGLNACGDCVRLISAPLPLSTTSSFDPGNELRAPTRCAPFAQGLHTLSAAGDVTFIDAKRIERNWLYRLIIGIKYKK
ncbi:hypothetical protein LWC05_00460 [Acetobacter sicerae]|uniref:Glucosamine inositolphosphorylceramide transferase 1 N-terminal domain-containing protein n=1 Tax=Acetobacter sicerae TaxID=85325 RepID=A0ABS8VTY3_9PROT|nr:hypothetical protein [Acetobacter sicerae]MCE0742372.1 hypothetical protein [Acetobacter sicerae]